MSKRKQILLVLFFLVPATFLTPVSLILSPWFEISIETIGGGIVAGLAVGLFVGIAALKYEESRMRGPGRLRRYVPILGFHSLMSGTILLLLLIILETICLGLISLGFWLIFAFSEVLYAMLGVLVILIGVAFCLLGILIWYAGQ